ncbi:hypothetical protein PT447_00170 [Aliarcobacter butzleri]|uniref:hypothetical protein n=1 Tax=Aliarcobacter butzleri TaxID=28197 RepID=UPI0024DE4330|nr:hypothetical protein [Aliarcobacter butzleri]MDK2063334.1 hypothetical protein [Aliarcobacter butzleri]
MLTRINLETLESNEIKFPKGLYLRPFKMTQRQAKPKNDKAENTYLDYKAAVNLKSSQFLEIVLDDFGFKLMDESQKGFCLSWDDIYKIKELNGFNKTTNELTDEDIEEEDEFLDKVYDFFLKVVIKEIKEWN